MRYTILVFRTSVSSIRDVKRVSSMLDKCMQIVVWSIDLEDWEKVLRIECDKKLKAIDVSNMLKNVGIFICELAYLETEKIQYSNGKQ